MKRYTFNNGLNKISLLFILVLLQLNYSLSQCTNASAYGTITAPTLGGNQTVGCTFAGEYNTANSVVATTNYISSTSVPTDFITVHQGSPAGPVIAFGMTPLNWTSTFVRNVLYTYQFGCCLWNCGRLS